MSNSSLFTPALLRTHSSATAVAGQWGVLCSTGRVREKNGRLPVQNWTDEDKLTLSSATYYSVEQWEILRLNCTCFKTGIKQASLFLQVHRLTTRFAAIIQVNLHALAGTSS